MTNESIPAASAPADDRPGRLRLRYYIDAHKALVIPITLAMMAIYDDWTTPIVWVYLGLHGTYSLTWLIKSRLFPDRSFDERVRTAEGLAGFAALTAFLVVPWLLLSGHAGHAPPWFIGLCVGLTVMGMFWHFASDMQKTVSLELNPGHLVTNHLWSIVRNPNYFGELLIYLGFTLLAVHIAPLVLLAFFTFAVWWPRMRKKDRSLSRYPEFAAYEARTKLFIPYVW